MHIQYVCVDMVSGSVQGAFTLELLDRFVIEPSSDFRRFVQFICGAVKPNQNMHYGLKLVRFASEYGLTITSHRCLWKRCKLCNDIIVERGLDQCLIKVTKLQIYSVRKPGSILLSLPFSNRRVTPLDCEVFFDVVSAISQSPMCTLTELHEKLSKVST